MKWAAKLPRWRRDLRGQVQTDTRLRRGRCGLLRKGWLVQMSLELLKRREYGRTDPDVLGALLKRFEGRKLVDGDF